MNVKETIRQRRKKRLLTLQAQHTDKTGRREGGAGVEPAAHQLPLSEPLLFQPDPEEQWKIRMDRWRAEELDKDEMRFRFLDSLRNRLLLSLIAGALVFTLFQLDMPWAKRGQTYLASALADEMDFAAAAAWYERNFAGSPAFLPALLPRSEVVESPQATTWQPGIAPVAGAVVARGFAELLSGVELAAPGGSVVRATETGRVLIVTAAKGESGATVVVQHPDERLSIYGNLQEITVSQSDWIEGGAQLGTMRPNGMEADGFLFFALREKGLYVDPAGVIAFE